MRKMESIVKRFYDELEAGRIMGRKCPKCGSVEFPPRIACTACGHFEMEWIEMSGRGQVTSFIEPSGMTGAQNEVFKPYDHRRGGGAVRNRPGDHSGNGR